jgi:hypothetical protein
LSKVLGVSCKSPQASIIHRVTAFKVQFYQASATNGDGGDPNARDAHEASQLQVCEFFQSAYMLQTSIGDLGAIA